MASFSFMFYWELIFGNLQLPEPFEIIEWRDFIFCGACRIAGLPLKAAGEVLPCPPAPHPSDPPLDRCCCKHVSRKRACVIVATV
jgi:hypothetical protein